MQKFRRACTDLQTSSRVHNDSVVVFSPGLCQPLPGDLCRLCIHTHLKHWHLRPHTQSNAGQSPQQKQYCRLYCWTGTPSVVV